MSLSTHPGRAILEAFAQRIAGEPMAPLGGPHAYDAEQAAQYRPSAVLALFTPTEGAARTGAAGARPEDGLDLFLVQRSPELRHHPGQIALPGGSLEAGEDEVGAALRETHEEIGVAPAEIEVLATLDPVLVPFSGFVVTPVLGWTQDPAPVDVSPGEVLHTLRVPLAHLLDPANRATVTIGGHGSAGFAVETGWVWGFTGNLLDHLFTELGWTRPWPHDRVHAMTMAEARGAHLQR